MATLDKWEKQHVEGIESCENEVKKTFLNAILEATTIAIIVSRIFKYDRVFRFKDYPIVKDRTDKLFAEFEQNINNVITTGIVTQWALANTKNDTLCRSIFSDKTIKKMSARLRQRYFSENNAAKNVFITRKTDGRTLSDRVWKYTNQFKEEIELALDIGIRDGLSADKMSLQLRQYLNEPNRLFRRVRDEHGNLVLSQAAKAYHPGQGVYRSSYKNARRLAATETNMAYRTSDYLRWQQLDFIVGIEIRLSNNHTLNGEPFFDICDILKGRYPKDFKFTGWHPLCRCYAVPILKTEEEMAEDNERILRGETPLTTSKRTVKDVSVAFKKWIEDNKERIRRAKKLPYFMRDNEKYVSQVHITDEARQSADQTQKFNEELKQKAGLRRISLTSEQKAHRKELQREAIAKFKGMEIDNIVKIKITATGIKEYLNQPHEQYFEKNELVRNLPDLIQQSEYKGAVLYHKDNDYFTYSHLFAVKISNRTSHLIAREDRNGVIIFHSISDDPDITKK